MEVAKAHTLLWTVPGCPYLVTIPANVLVEIRSAVVDAYYSAPRGGVEIGGVFFGLRVGDSLYIQDYRAIECQYLTGPSFTLSDQDKSDLSEVLKLPKSDPKLAKLAALGWYHSHNRSEIFLSPKDLQLHTEFFPEPWQIALVLRPEHMRPTRAGFFFHDRDGEMKSDAPTREFILEPPGYGLTLLEPMAEDAVARTLESHAVHAPEHDRSTEKLTGEAGLASPSVPAAREPAPVPRAADPGISNTLPEVPPTQEQEPKLGEDRGMRHAMHRVRVEFAEAQTRALPSPPAPPQEVVHTESGKPAEKPPSPQEKGWGARWTRFLQSLVWDSERRSAKRESGEGLLAFYWDGDRPKAHRVRDISKHGAYVESDFAWTPGTMMVLTLQITSSVGAGGGPPDAIAVPAEVVRSTQEGMGLRFVLPDLQQMRVLLQFLLRWNPNMARG